MRMQHVERAAVIAILATLGFTTPAFAAPSGPPAAAQNRCPELCVEASVACTAFILWNTCWCPMGGGTCPNGAWWVGGVCIGGWIDTCQP
jgi:hypothetical protein